MGYTHYIDGVKATSELAESAKRIVDVAEAEGIVTYGVYDDEPRIDEHCISIAGDGGEDLTIVDDWLAQRTRSRLSRYHSFRFTKTNRRPYDAIVCAILIAAMTQGQDGFSSDGTFHDWVNLGGVSLDERAIAPLTREQVRHLSDILDGELTHPDTVPISVSAYHRCSPAVREVIDASFTNPIVGYRYIRDRL